MEERNRRFADVESLAQQREIDDLIKQENDPKQRIFLMVLQQMSKSLHANTVITQGIEDKLITHIDKFEAHTTAEDAMLNKGRGAWWVLGAALAIAQAIGLMIFFDVRDDLKNIHDGMQQDMVNHTRIDGRLDTLEMRVK